MSDRIELHPHGRRVRVRLDGRIIAETTEAIRLEEKGLAPRLYIPRADASSGHLEPSHRRTHCPYKGDATYYSVVIDGATAEDAVWSYEDPIPSMRGIKGHLCFDPSRGIEIEEDDPQAHLG